MTHSALVKKTVPHHNKFHSRGGIAISRVIVHHWASTNGGDTSLADPNRNASVNYFVYSDGSIAVQVPEEFRAWTSGGPEADLPSITIEVQNSSTQVFNNNNDDPRSWAVSDKALEALVGLIADIAKRYKWGSVTRSRVRGHREFDSTACPGGYLWHRLDSIANDANDRLTSKPKKPVAKDIEMRTIYNEQDNNDETRRASVGELTFHVQGATASSYERKMWGKPVNVNQSEWNSALAQVNARRGMLGLPKLKGVRGESMGSGK